MNNLPEDCIAKILSLTTPLDVCRLSAVSSIFRSAAGSDDVWNHFLPADFPAGFAAPAGLPTRKQLFFSLVDNPLLINGTLLVINQPSSFNPFYIHHHICLSVPFSSFVFIQPNVVTL